MPAFNYFWIAVEPIRDELTWGNQLPSPKHWQWGPCGPSCLGWSSHLRRRWGPLSMLPQLLHSSGKPQSNSPRTSLLLPSRTPCPLCLLSRLCDCLVISNTNNTNYQLFFLGPQGRLFRTINFLKFSKVQVGLLFKSTLHGWLKPLGILHDHGQQSSVDNLLNFQF